MIYCGLILKEAGILYMYIEICRQVKAITIYRRWMIDR